MAKRFIGPGMIVAYVYVIVIIMGIFIYPSIKSSPIEKKLVRGRIHHLVHYVVNDRLSTEIVHINDSTIRIVGHPVVRPLLAECYEYTVVRFKGHDYYTLSDDDLRLSTKCGPVIPYTHSISTDSTI